MEVRSIGARRVRKRRRARDQVDLGEVESGPFGLLESAQVGVDHGSVSRRA
jgi:hypothetical protein